MKYIKQIAYILLLIGGIIWGVYGVSGYNLVDVILGGIPMIANIVYVLVGLSSVYIILNKYALCGCGTCACKQAESVCCNSCSVEDKK
jgi:uncharacterized membrane protein YuzA (DUF378 family)